MKSEDIKTLERVLKALANKRRLEILSHLKKSKQSSVGDIAFAINLSFRSTSRHLAVLRNCDLIAREQIGLTILYHIVDTKNIGVKTILNSL
jgi:DNA-binding transcriptional ArsR family regulator